MTPSDKAMPLQYWLGVSITDFLGHEIERKDIISKIPVEGYDHVIEYGAYLKSEADLQRFMEAHDIAHKQAMENGAKLEASQAEVLYWKKLALDCEYWSRRAADAESGDCDRRIFKDLMPKLLASEDKLQESQAQVAELIEALEFECGNRCASGINPCNAREVIDRHKKENE